MFLRLLGRPVGLTSEIRRGWFSNVRRRPFSGTQGWGVAVEEADSNAEATKPTVSTSELSQLRGDVTLALKLNERTNSEMHGYVKMMFTFAVGTILLGLGTGGYKLFFHNAARDKEWKQDMKEQEKSLKEFVKETVANSESRIMAELKIIEARRRWW